MTQNQALNILKTGANVFLTGEPGSGKTHTVNLYVAYLRSRGVEPAVTASTGIAATHLGGVTIHSWSGIGIKTRLDKYELDRISSREYVVKRLRRTSVLIIDEVSMLSAETLALVDAVCREVKQTTEPFGGLQVVFVGDFFQLPPIIKNTLEEKAPATLLAERSARFAYDSPVWSRLNPLVCYLSEQYRQDDAIFLAFLSALRRNNVTAEQRNYLATRKISHEQAPAGAPKLFSHNVDVDTVNNEKLGKLPGDQKKFTMLAQGPAALVAALKKGCLSPEELWLKVGAKVMCTKNNPKAGFANGTLGVVVGFSHGSYRPIIEMRNGRKIEIEPMDWTVEEGGIIRATITQLPLRLAWAITVHKSQGMSLDEAVMDLSGVFEFGQGYVALSRVRRLAGLHLLGWNEQTFQVHPEVLAKDDFFRQLSAEATEKFSNLTSSELEKMHKNFIRAVGDKNVARASKKKRRPVLRKIREPHYY